MTEINGFVLMLKIGSTPEAFAVVRLEAEKSVLGVLGKALKAKSLNLEMASGICSALSPKGFAFLLDSLSDKDAAALAKKLDKGVPGLADMSAAQHREHVYQLATGSRRPTVKAGKKTSKEPKMTSAAEPKWSNATRVRR